MIFRNNHFQVPSTPDVLVYDAFIPENPKGVILFIHGFKGFKDWGAWNACSEAWMKEGWAVLKFNFSHNGTGLEETQTFVHPEKFRKNTYSRERMETLAFLDFIRSGEVFPELRKLPLFVIGHSRGAGAAINAASHPSVKGIVTWAGISKYNRWGEEQRQRWEIMGSMEIINQRTGESLPLDIDLLQDYQRNKNILRIKTNVQRMLKPMLIIHGTADEAVSWEEALRLKKWNAHADLHLVEGANHVFGASHPWNSEEPPHALKGVAEKTIRFFENVKLPKFP